jgi:hypothetical protein
LRQRAGSRLCEKIREQERNSGHAPHLCEWDTKAPWARLPPRAS